MQNLAKKKTTFSRDIPFISTCFIVNTSKCKYLAKKSFSFLQDFAFTSIENETCTNKSNISRKSRFLFCKILHLLVLKMKHVLINRISREKVVFLFARFCIY